MGDDPIRVALAAAESAVGRSLHEAGLPAALTPQWHAEAAAAIAAFLRALPHDRMLWLDSAPGRQLGLAPTTHKALAAAVERAAKEAGDE